MLLTWGQGGGLNAGLSLWLPFNDLGSGAVDTSAATAAGSGTPTFTRATTATTFDVNGAAPISVASGTARSYYDPASHLYLGYLAEEARTNVLLNSKIDGTNLATQSVTVTAQAYTLSFYGTGTVTLSGTATGAKVGTGAYPTRSSFTFTPTAGTLTLTVTGTVQYANLEAGSFATSFIPTAGATVTRNADVLTYPTSGNVLASAGTCYAELFANEVMAVGQRAAVGFSASIAGPLYRNAEVATTIRVSDESVSVAKSSLTDMSTASRKRASSWGGASGLVVTGDGATVATGTFDGAMGGTSIAIGSATDGSGSWNGTIRNVRIWTRALADSQLVSLTA